MKKIINLLLIPFLFTSCATVLNGKYQLVEIKTNPKTDVLIDGKKPRTKKGKYFVERDSEFKQIELKQEGYKSQYEVIAPLKTSPLYYLSWAPIALMPIHIYFAYAAPIFGFYDTGGKSKNYKKSYTFEHNLISIPKKDSLFKQISLNNVAIDVKSKDFTINYSRNYKEYLRENYDTKNASENDEYNDLKVENTIFSEALNELLNEKGYIDTTKSLFKVNYANNLYLDAKITKCTINVAHLKQAIFNASNTGITSTTINIEWRLLNYYKEPIYSFSTQQSSSGDFIYQDKKEVINSVTFAIKDAIEFSLFEFMNDKKLIKTLKDSSLETKEEDFEKIIISKRNSSVKKLSEAVKSSVTIKTEIGHGSGFIISSDGYIITNHHVIAGNKQLKVIMNNEKEYEAQLIRSSRTTDLALLKINAQNLVPFELNASKNIELATEIYAVGTPTAEDLSQTISKGIISGVRKTGDHSKLIQTDASINAGNSGGAIVNEDGLVLGIVSSKLSGFGIEGVAFGIPAYEIFDKLKISFEEVAEEESIEVGNR